ncbi:GNAT family N-acetyltransferase [Desulfobacter postgatei]|jgi:GNAT superfamily N-acetyltransferase|uniref:GNAT family N-acetyltransferase n=1 Tax=Desulfobacter postgatei TaxID=2293 RepID=UPI002A35F124|nr:GNAT family N-acetyltransferase [Desulfobacter postgatei]MDX9963353.1 GNAT family N-acetyltransferase [Desulfobacter postgatei]
MIQGIVDLAVVTAPINQFPQIIEACAQKGAAGAVIISGGGRETGEQGARIERQIKAAAGQSGMRIIGPNCIGIAHPPSNLNASHMPGTPAQGRIAFLSESGGKIIGSARIIFTASGTEGEFAIMLADSWQGKGIGAALLKSCLAFSKRYGLKRVFGVVLRENRQMLLLADKLGFKKASSPASNEIELIIDIEKLDLYTL